MRFPRLLVLTSSISSALLAVACSTTPQPIAHPVAPAAPRNTSGKSSGPAQPGIEHAAALEQLAVAEYGERIDRQKSVKIWLPDAKNWRRVRFFGVKSLAGFRYGKDHHAVAGLFVLDVENRTAETCHQAFEKWTRPYLDTFEVDVQLGAPQGFAWRNAQTPQAPAEILSAATLRAGTATLLSRQSYLGTYSVYPAWKDKCLVLGIATAIQGEEERAKKVRDRLAAEVFAKLEITAATAPTEAY